MRRILLASVALACLISTPADANRIRAKLHRTAAPEPPSGVAPLIPGVTAVGSWNQSATPADISNATTCPVAGSNPCRQSIGNWNMVQYQDITASTYLEVLAHQSPTTAEQALGTDDAITGVDLNCDAGEWIPAVYEVNTAGHNVWRLPLDPANFTNGFHECRFRIQPTQGRALVGQGVVSSSASVSSFFFTTNHSGTIPTALRYVAASGGRSTSGCGVTSGDACSTLVAAATELKTALGGTDVGGGVACLLAGNHTFGDATNPGKKAAAQRWMTIEPCSGVTRAQAVINAVTLGGGTVPRGIGVEKLRLHNITVGISVPVDGNSTKVGPTAALWMDDIEWDGRLGAASGGDYYSQPIGGTNSPWLGGRWITDSTFQYAINGPKSAVLMRDTEIHHIISDAADEMRTALGITFHHVDDLGRVDANGNTYHTDTFQYDIGVVTNVILEDMVGTDNMVAPIFFSDGSGHLTNFAIVNNVFSDSGGFKLWQWNNGGDLINGYVRGNSFTGSIYFVGTDISGGFVWVENTCSDTDFDMSAGGISASTFLGNTGCAP